MMRTLFLLVTTALLLAGCSGELRTHPIARPTPTTPQRAIPLEDPIARTERELANAEFSQHSPNSPTWQKGTKNGGVIVVLAQENGVTATVQYNRIDGKVVCKIPEPRESLVGRIQEMDSITSAGQLVTRHNCTPT